MRTARIGLCLLVLLAVTVVPAAVRVEHDPGFNLSKYRTYAWKTGAPALYPQIQEKIVAGVNRELTAAGLTLVEGEADLYVTTYAYGEGAPKVSMDPGFWGGASSEGMEGMAPTSSVRVNTAGTLMVRLVDAETDKPVWAGVAEKAVSENLTKALRKVEKMITKIFQDFPPQP
jgi:hypothetical protein